MLDWGQYPYFSENEFRCRCGCGKADMTETFMNRILTLRKEYNHPMTISSGYRCKEYNDSINGGPEHTLGKAADIAISGRDARLLLNHATLQFPRIGISQKGMGRFIHIGVAEPQEVGGCSPWLWSY